MLDTVMVLWARGRYGRFLQTLAAFLLLFAGICVLLLLVTASGVKWPGLAVTAVPPMASVTVGAASARTAARAIVPIILQNPTPQATYPPMQQPTMQATNPPWTGAKRPQRRGSSAGARPMATPAPLPTPDDQAFFP